jgi:hypothetical protein
MHDLAIGYILAAQVTAEEVRSALPDAPTLPHPVRARGRTRSVVASWLYTAADRIAPNAAATSVRCRPATAC